jgi:uroporphyrinogen decarboxylase
VDFAPGPVIAAPIRGRDQVEALAAPDPREAVPFVFEILRALRKELEGPQVPLIGFAGAPFTLAAYLVEGAGSKEFSTLKRMMYTEPEVLHALQRHLTDWIVDYLNAQIEAGAQVVQLFDTWAGILGPADYRTWVLPVHKEIAARVERDRAPLILYVKGGAHVLDCMIESGADVLSLDWRIDFARAAWQVGHRASLQGNRDPCALMAPREEIAARVAAIAEAAAPARGLILNLGHGCLPDTPIEGVRAFTAAARALGRRGAEDRVPAADQGS